MQIAFFLQSRDFGGAEKFAVELLTELKNRQHSIQLYTSNQKILHDQIPLTMEKIPIYLDFAGNYRGLIKSLMLLPFALVYYFITLLKVKQSNSDCIVIASGFSEKIVIAPLCRLLKLTLVLIEYGPLMPLFEKLHGIPGFLYQVVKNNSQKVIVSSIKTKNSLKGIFPPKKIVHIPCGTKAPMASFATHNNSPEILKPLLVCVGRLQKDKGQDLLIHAFQQLQKKYPKLELYIIGQGEQARYLENLADKEDRIHFLKSVKNQWHYLYKASVVVCPSVWDLEGFGLVVTEAMAIGKAIVAFNRPPYNELVKHRYSALLASNNNAHDLAKQIDELLQNPQLRQEISANAKKEFLKKYRIEQAAQNYEKALQQL